MFIFVFDKTQLIDLPKNSIMMYRFISWIEDSIIAGIRMPYPKILLNSIAHTFVNEQINDEDEDEDEDEYEDEDEDDGFIVPDDYESDSEYKLNKKIKN